MKSTLADMVSRFSFAEPSEVGALDNTFPRYNGAPSQWYPIIVLDELAMGSMMFVSGRWGLMTRTGGMMINARSELWRRMAWSNGHINSAGL